MLYVTLRCICEIQRARIITDNRFSAKLNFLRGNKSEQYQKLLPMDSALRAKYEQFRALLVEARLKAGLTQSEVASKLNQPQSYVSKYERGERRLDVVEFLEVARIIGFNPIAVISKIWKEKSGAKRPRGRKEK